MKKVKLFCIPHAGGSAAVYSKWKKYINPSIEICPIELAGRGKRFNENLYNNINEIVEDIYEIIKNNLQTDYAFFGHSMGSLIAYELTYHIMKLKNKSPKHIFFSGKKAPHIMYKNRLIHTLSDIEFKNRILEFSGTPKEVFENRDMLNIFAPILRADLGIFETYKYVEKHCKLDCNITIINGKNDDLTINDISGWKQHTSKSCSIYLFNGGHFYLNENLEALISIINTTLN
ncbi:thioesterase II family protein [Clostridium sp. DJ247]|uniref:thioesterase II family protein n=1 Tax=Clostridium sp. DJ247 TaxID=2726188 RepID=UPI001629771C|nr:thioesterase [Clostridium sp. DJ247]MBC2578803.1 thioesterase [Clostridium sp. DJ247]